jgi:hypothetical protein
MSSHDLIASASNQLNVSESLTATDSTSATVISNFAWQHLKSATLFRDQVLRLEMEHVGESIGEFWVEIRSYASSCIMATAASLEALINELFIARNCALRPLLPDFETEFWGKKGLEKKPILIKYQRALSLLGVPLLDTTLQLYQDADALIELRNALVHYKPTWDPDRLRKMELVDALEGRFQCSPFVPENADFLTSRCMGHGCAAWAIDTAFSFLHEFSSRVSIDPHKMVSFWALESLAPSRPIVPHGHAVYPAGSASQR